MDELFNEQSNSNATEYEGQLITVSWGDSIMKRQIRAINLDLSRSIDTPAFFRFNNVWTDRLESLLDEAKQCFGFSSQAELERENDIQLIMDWKIEQRDLSLVQSPLKLIIKTRQRDGDSNLYDQTVLETPYISHNEFGGEEKRLKLDSLCYRILIGKLFNLASSVSGRILPRNSKTSPRYSVSSTTAGTTSTNSNSNGNINSIQDATIRLLLSKMDQNEFEEEQLECTTNSRRDSFISSRRMSNTHDIYSQDIMSGMRMEAFPDIFYSPLVIIPDDEEQQRIQSYGVYEFFRPHTCSYGILSGSNLHANRVIIKLEDQYIETRIVINDIREDVKKEFMFKGSFDLENEFQNIVNIFDMFTR